MRALIWIITIFAVAVGLSLMARYNEGYVLVFYPPYRFDFSLTLFVLVLIFTLIAMWGIGHLFNILYSFPKRVQAYRGAQATKAKAEEADNLLAQAFAAALAGDPVTAQMKAEEARLAGASARLVGVVAPHTAGAAGAADKT